MIKQEQLYVNNIVERAREAALKDAMTSIISRKNLRKCNAIVEETKSWYILRSYNTLVAAIDKSSGICYDFLRLVYGYTATSSMHINKFKHDYTTIDTYMWRAVK